MSCTFFFNDPAPTEIYTLSLHDALPISPCSGKPSSLPAPPPTRAAWRWRRWCTEWRRSEEHTSELQSLAYLVCRLLLEKKKRPPGALQPVERRCPPRPDLLLLAAREDHLGRRVPAVPHHVLYFFF